MKYVLAVALLFGCMGMEAFEVSPYGPVASTLHFANFFSEPISFGGSVDNEQWLFLHENGTWNYYSPWVQGLAAKATCMLTEDMMMVAYAGGSYSDGVYNLDLTTHQWTLNEWFFRPNFIRKCQSGSTYFVGERDGLFRSDDGGSWSRVVALGEAECNSFDSYDTHLVANCGSNVYYSTNDGLSWQTSSMGNLRSFRFAAGGVLYAIMDVGSDSDGIWRSDDYGATWVAVYYTSNLSCIGPEYNGYLTLGWDEPNDMGYYVALLTPQHTMYQLIHTSLHSPVVQMDVFPLINTPSFFVVSALGCHYVTSFLPAAAEDATAPPITEAMLEFSPNPSQEGMQISIKTTSSEALSLNIYNLKGQLIRNCRNIDNPKKDSWFWDGKDENGHRVGNGIYLVQALNSQGKLLAVSKATILK